METIYKRTINTETGRASVTVSIFNVVTMADTDGHTIGRWICSDVAALDAWLDDIDLTEAPQEIDEDDLNEAVAEAVAEEIESEAREQTEIIDAATAAELAVEMENIWGDILTIYALDIGPAVIRYTDAGGDERTRTAADFDAAYNWAYARGYRE